MTGHVRQRLLGDAEYLIFKSGGERPIGATDIEVDRELFRGALFGKASETGGQSVLRGDRREGSRCCDGLLRALLVRIPE